MYSDQIVPIPFSQITKTLSDADALEVQVYPAVYADINADESLPKRSDNLHVILCNKGEAQIRIDLESHILTRNSLVIVWPSEFVSFSIGEISNLEMTVLVCPKKYFEKIIPRLSDLLPLMVQRKTDNVLRLSDSEMDNFKSLIRLIGIRASSPPSPFGKEGIISLMRALICEILDRKAASGRQHTRSRKEELMARFIIEVSNNFRSERQVSFYAQKLFISPKHLSSVVKDVSGQTAGEWIENYVIMEAKFLLKTTDLTIQQIADTLNFKNQSFFGKYFKNITGTSPSSFRTRPLD